MKFWKLALHSYLYGMLAMFVTLLVYSLVMSDWMELFYWARALVTIPVTPVGLPFFIGSMYGAKKYFDKVSQKGQIMEKGGSVKAQKGSNLGIFIVLMVIGFLFYLGSTSVYETYVQLTKDTKSENQGR